MKNILMMLLCILLAAVLTAGAVCIGARNGWLKEREEAISAFSAGDDAASLEERAMDAANLHVVASRHLSADDPALATLQEARTVLLSATASASEKAQADMALTSAARELASTLPALKSVQQSERDLVYITALTRTLTQGRDALAYALSVQDFNRRLTTAFTGRLAMMLGVAPIDVP